MGSYTEDLEKRNEELSEALEEISEVNKELIKKFMEYAIYVQKISSVLNSNFSDIHNEIHTEDPASDHPQFILKEAILNKETINEINSCTEWSKKLIQTLKDKTRDMHDKLLEMYNE